jgi:hypothetical protein
MNEEKSKNLEDEVPSPIRTGMITSISLFLGFALVVLRVWGHGPGDWEFFDLFVIIPIGFGIILFLLALFLALNPKYLTVKCFRVSMYLFFLGVFAVLIGVAAGAFDKD